MQLHGSVAEAFTSRNEEPLVELDVRLSLVGHHQLDNAATAIATAAHLKHSGAFEGITIDSIKQGLETAHLPGRFQIKRLSNSRKDALVVLDGAHTAESAAALAKTVKAAFPDAAIGLVVAMAADKDHAGFCAALRALSPVVVVFTEVAVAGGRARSAPPGVLAAAWQAASMAPVSGGRPVRTRQLIQASLTAAVAKADMELGAVTAPERVVVVCGSLHAVGAALNQLPLEP